MAKNLRNLFLLLLALFGLVACGAYARSYLNEISRPFENYQGSKAPTLAYFKAEYGDHCGLEKDATGDMLKAIIDKCRRGNPSNQERIPGFDKFQRKAAGFMIVKYCRDESYTQQITRVDPSRGLSTTSDIPIAHGAQWFLVFTADNPNVPENEWSISGPPIIYFVM